MVLLIGCFINRKKWVRKGLPLQNDFLFFLLRIYIQKSCLPEQGVICNFGCAILVAQVQVQVQVLVLILVLVLVQVQVQVQVQVLVIVQVHVFVKQNVGFIHRGFYKSEKWVRKGLPFQNDFR